MNREAHDTVRDVLLFPPHSRRAPAFEGETCQRNGTKVAAPVVAVLDNNKTEDAALRHYAADDATLFAAKQAWKIETKTARFLPLAADELRCPRSGIITADGGP